AVGDASPGDASPDRRDISRDRKDGDPLRLDPGHLAEAKRVWIGRAVAGDAENDRPRSAIAPSQKLFQRHVACAIAAHDGHCRIEREQRAGEIAVWRWGEQIAADRSHRAHRRTADRARWRVKERKIAVTQDLGKRSACADRDARAHSADLAQRALVEAYDRRDPDIALIKGAHDERAAADKARGTVRREGRRRFGRRRESPHHHRHAGPSLIMPPRANACEWPRILPDRSPRRPFRSGVSRPGPCREARFPLPECAVAISHRQQPDMSGVVEERDRRIDQAIAEALIEVGERQQLLAQLRAVGELETADAADAIRALSALDDAGRDRGVPAVVAIEIAQHRPDPIAGSIDDRAFDHVRHLYPPNARFSASNPPWNVPPPMLAMRSASRSGGQSNSAVHSTKVRSPSVTGVSRSVAT